MARMLQYFIKTKLSLKYIFIGIFVIYVTITINLLSWISRNHKPETRLVSEILQYREDRIQKNSQETGDNEIQDTERNTDINNHIIVENSMKRKRKILAQLIQEYQQNQDVPQKKRFSFQSIGNISVFSAFYDDRLNLDYEAAVVRILGISRLDSLETLVCRYTDKGVDSWVLATKYEMCENHDKVYGGFVYLCNAPRNLQFVPRKVYVQNLSNLKTDSNSGERKTASLDLIQIKRKLTMKAMDRNYDYGFDDNFYQSEDEDNDDNFADDKTDADFQKDISQNGTTMSTKLSYKDNRSTTAEDGLFNSTQSIKTRLLRSYDMQLEPGITNPNTTSTYQIAICVPPLFGDIKLSHFIQFVEFHKLQKVNQFFFYTMDITRDMTKILQYYQEEKLATVIEWSLPPGVRDNIWYNGQIVAIQDCLYRTIGHYDYVAFIDIDELIVPKLDSDWLGLLQRLHKAFPDTENSLTKGYSFKSAFFDPDKTKDTSIDSQKHLKLTFLNQRERNEIISTVRTKLIIQPEFVVEMGIHHVSQTLNMLFNVTVNQVSQSTALIHHYRPCTMFADKHMQCGNFVTDNSILKFEDSLVKSFMDVVKRNMKYLKHR